MNNLLIQATRLEYFLATLDTSKLYKKETLNDVSWYRGSECIAKFIYGNKTFYIKDGVINGRSY